MFTLKSSNTLWSPEAWQDFMSWTLNNRKFVKRINDLIQDIQRNGLLEGIGKPECLKHSPNYSRRIDKSNRLIYRVENGYLYIVSCKGHYEEED